MSVDDKFVFKGGWVTLKGGLTYPIVVNYMKYPLHSMNWKCRIQPLVKTTTSYKLYRDIEKKILDLLFVNYEFITMFCLSVRFGCYFCQNFNLEESNLLHINYIREYYIGIYSALQDVMSNPQLKDGR